MFEGIYAWVRSLAGYFLFVTVMEQLMPGKKYGKYVRLFSGLVLIFLVVQPLADQARLEERIARDYESLLFQYEAGDLKEEILGMEHERLLQMVRQYEEAVAGDIRQMAEDSGASVRDCQVSICADQDSENFGTVTAVKLYVYSGEKGGEEVTGSGDIQPGKLDIPEITPVPPVEIAMGEVSGREASEWGTSEKEESGREASEWGTSEKEGSGREASEGEASKWEASGRRTSGNGELSEREAAAGAVGYTAAFGLRRKIAAYYNLEEAYVEIQMVEREG